MSGDVENFDEEHVDGLRRHLADAHRELAAMTAAKELAERQVAVLTKHVATYSSCFGCTARDTHRACQHSDATFRERLAAWSRAEAAEGGKG